MPGAERRTSGAKTASRSRKRLRQKRTKRAGVRPRVTGDQSDDEDARPGTGMCKGNKERVGNRPGRRTKRKKSEAGAGQSGPNRRKPTRPGLFD